PVRYLCSCFSRHASPALRLVLSDERSHCASRHISARRITERHSNRALVRPVPRLESGRFLSETESESPLFYFALLSLYSLHGRNQPTDPRNWRAARS